jgi:hypothetical protein
MTDITKCLNKTCPIQDSCLRHLELPDQFGQYYQTFFPIIDEQENFVDCDFFKPIPEVDGKKNSNNIKRGVLK